MYKKTTNIGIRKSHDLDYCNDLLNFVRSDEETRFVFNGVLHHEEENMRVASDGRHLAIVYNYPSQLEAFRGKILAHNMEIIDGIFPDYKNVIPDRSLCKKLTLTHDRVSLYMESLSKVKSPIVLKTGDIHCLVKPDKYLIPVIESYLLKKNCKETLDLYIKDGASPIILEREDLFTYVAMPMKMKEFDSNYLVLDLGEEENE